MSTLAQNQLFLFQSSMSCWPSLKVSWPTSGGTQTTWSRTRLLQCAAVNDHGEGQVETCYVDGLGAVKDGHELWNEGPRWPED
jgi:hypothetical protein